MSCPAGKIPLTPSPSAHKGEPPPRSNFFNTPRRRTSSRKSRRKTSNNSNNNMKNVDANDADWVANSNCPTAVVLAREKSLKGKKKLKLAPKYKEVPDKWKERATREAG